MGFRTESPATENSQMVYEPFVAQWSLYVPHSGHYMYRQFNILKFYVLPTSHSLRL